MSLTVLILWYQVLIVMCQCEKRKCRYRNHTLLFTGIGAWNGLAQEIAEVNTLDIVTARDELQVHYDTFIEEYSNKLVS